MYGGLEAVDFVREVGKNGNAIARVCSTGEEVFVRNGANKADQYLVRADSRFNPKEGIKGPIHLVNFISEDISHSGLTASQYILYASWKTRMGDLVQESTLRDLNNWYDPGNLSFAFYIKDDSTSKNRGLIIRHNESEPFSGSFHGIISDLPMPNVGARLIVSDSKHNLKIIRKIISEKSLVPVKMQPLK